MLHEVQYFRLIITFYEKKLKINFEISFSEPFFSCSQWISITFIVLTCVCVSNFLIKCL